MHLFYVKNIVSDIYCFDKEESRHCKVLRLKTGDTVFLTDGRGTMCEAKITDNDQSATKTKIITTHTDYNKPGFFLHIAISPTKSPERFEWFLEKSTEIGISEITPLICERSEKKNLKYDRLEKIVISAMKQSFSAYLPKINPAKIFNDVVSATAAGQKFIAYCDEAERSELKSICLPAKPALILIGPEGDFTPNEIGLAKKNHFLPISLGNSRLRTETAGVVACNIVNLINS